MRRITFAVLTSLALASSLTPAGATARAARTPAAAEAPAGAKAGSSAELTPEQAGAAAELKTKARQQEWDRKMKAVSGSICRGC